MTAATLVHEGIFCFESYTRDRDGTTTFSIGKDFLVPGWSPYLPRTSSHVWYFSITSLRCALIHIHVPTSTFSNRRQLCDLPL